MVDSQLGTVLQRLRKMVQAREDEVASDVELLQRFLAQREESAFVSLLQRHGPMVLHVCRRIQGNEHDAEDAFQATFLLLARKAGSIRKQESVASWLHGVAHRLALEAKGQGARRQARERRAADMRRTSPVSEKAWQELQTILDEALQQVPERYRAPLLLCYLQGKTQEEAARLLACPLGTLRSRVARGRDRLRSVLEKRGLRLSATSLAAALAARESLAGVPPLLLQTTARAAIAYAPGLSPTALVSARAAALLETLTHSSLVSTSKILSALVLAICACAGGAGLFGHRLSAAMEDPPANAQMAQTKKQPVPQKRGAATSPLVDQTDGPVEIKGRVLDPEGRPVAEAKLYFGFYALLTSGQPNMPNVRATTSRTGAFHFNVPRSELSTLVANASWSKATLAAVAPGYGPGWLELTQPEQAGALTIRLAKDDVPLEGRVVNLEGRPIAGVKVTIGGLEAPTDEDLTAWLAAAHERPGERWAFVKRYFPSFPVLPEYEMTTAADGRFHFTGVGRERIATLSLAGPTIEAHDRDIFVVSRSIKPFHVSTNSRIPEIGNDLFYGTGCDIAVAPSRPIVGTVADRDTGKPIAGATIQSVHFAGHGNLAMDFLRTTSDAQGHYRLVGLPKGQGNAIVAIPGQGQPYFARETEVTDNPGIDPIQVDFGLHRGIWLRGRVTDKKTGRPIAAIVHCGVFLDNPQGSHLPHDEGRYHGVHTGADGAFQVLGLPGHGLLAVKADQDRYPAGQGFDAIPPASKRDVDGVRMVVSSPIFMPDEYHAFVSVEPSDDGRHASCNIALEPGRSVSGTVVGPDGKPLDVVEMIDPKMMWQKPVILRDSHFTATALDPGRPRWFFFHQHARQWGAALQIRGDETDPLTVRLQPCGSATGRVLDAKGRPWSGLSVFGRSKPSYMSVTTLQWRSDYVSSRTDDQGRFRVDGLIPGVEYQLRFGGRDLNVTLLLVRQRT